MRSPLRSCPPRRRRDRDERGAVAVEMALVTIPLLMMVFGIVQYGFYFWSMQGGADAARQAARMASVGSPAGCADFGDAVRDSLAAVSSDPGGAEVTRAYTKASGNTAVHRQVGDLVEVTVAFDGHDFLLPFVPFVEDARVEHSASARVEYVPTQSIAACP